VHVYRNEEIGKAFGVGYTAVTAAVERVGKYLKESSRFEMIIKKIINDR
jgi:hypothetical protein